jgi:hypothetical protein
LFVAAVNVNFWVSYNKHLSAVCKSAWVCRQVTDDEASLDDVDDTVVDVDGRRGADYAADLEGPDPQGGGLIVYQGTRGDDVKDNGYKINDNNPDSQAKLREYLRDAPYMRIPFRQNRMVFFNSGAC